MVKTTATDYQELDQIWQLMNQKLSLIKALRPLNYQAEKEKFFASNMQYNPQFVYQPVSELVPQIRRQLQQVDLPETKIGQLYRAKVEESLLFLRLLESIGHDQQFLELNQQLFGLPQAEYLPQARQIINKLADLEDETVRLNAQQIKQVMHRALDKFGLPGKVKVVSRVDRLNRISITKVSQTLLIGSQANRSQANLKGLIAHELLTHLMRSTRGRQQKYGIFAYGTAGYFRDEEGLATLMGCLQYPQGLLISARSYLLLDLARRASFVELFSLARQFYPETELAWHYCMRFKRGMSDTSLPGSFLKNQYFGWLINTVQQLSDHPEWLQTAFNGKACLSELAEFTQPSDIPWLSSFISSEKINQFQQRFLKLDKLDQV